MATVKGAKKYSYSKYPTVLLMPNYVFWKKVFCNGCLAGKGTENTA